MGSTKEERIYYDTLRSNEVECLKTECLKVIRMETQNNCCDEGIDFLCSLFSCCPNLCGDSRDVNEDVIEVTELLINKGYVRKMFYQEENEEDSKNISKAMFLGANYSYDNIDPYQLAGGLKMYCKEYLGYYLPKDVHLLLLYSYRDNMKHRKKQIISRVPFIMGEYHRLFFIQIFRLFRNIDHEVQRSETSLDNLLDIFGPLLIKNPSAAEEFNGFTKKQILKDLMEVDFFIVPNDFF